MCFIFQANLCHLHCLPLTVVGLTADGAASKWKRDFNDRTIRKDQVSQLQANGEPSGKMVWRIFVPKRSETRDVVYKDSVGVGCLDFGPRLGPRVNKLSGRQGSCVTLLTIQLISPLALLEDRSAGMTLEQRAKATDSNVAAMQRDLQSAVEAACAETSHNAKH